MFGKEFSKLILHVYICKYLLYVVRYVRILFCRVLNTNYLVSTVAYCSWGTVVYCSRGTVTVLLQWANHCYNGQITVADTVVALLQRANNCSNGHFTVPKGFLPSKPI